jgi:tyrosyl-tRNA synthetase
MISPADQLAQVRRGTATIIPEEELRAKLAEGRPLRVKLGVDPNVPDIHLGHTVALAKLRQFLGHHAVLIIGDFTAMIGDPSGRAVTRPQLTRAQVAEAAKTYQDQVFKVLDRQRLEVHCNSEWLARLTFDDVVHLCAQSTVARMLERDDFAKRYAEGAPISIHEFLYPLMQARDSVEIRADIELGGTDQTFNILLGRQLQKTAGQPLQVAVILPLLIGTDGVQKMSKSLGNYIGVAESPHEIFGKIMSISDEVMLRYYELLTQDDVADLRQRIDTGALHPMEAKKRLGEILVARFHDAGGAARARAAFEERFQHHHLDAAALPEVVIERGEKIWLPGVLRQAGLAKSSSDARRLIRQHGVRIDGVTVTAEELPQTKADLILEVGKRRAVRVRFRA